MVRAIVVFFILIIVIWTSIAVDELNKQKERIEFLEHKIIPKYKERLKNKDIELQQCKQHLKAYGVYKYEYYD